MGVCAQNIKAGYVCHPNLMEPRIPVGLNMDYVRCTNFLPLTNKVKGRAAFGPSRLNAVLGTAYKGEVNEKAMRFYPD